MQTVGKVFKTPRAIVLSVLRRSPKLRLPVRGAYWKWQALRYQKIARATTTDRKLVFFEAFGGRQFTCSPKALYLAMLDNPQFQEYRFVWCFKKDHCPDDFDLNGRVSVVERGTADYFAVLAQAGTIVMNNRLPEYVSLKADQTYVQCWHGTPLKRLGFDVPESASGALNTASELAKRFKLDADKWTYLLSPSAYTSKHLADAFGLPEEKRAQVILEEGYPRNDAIVNTLAAPDAKEQIEAIKRKLGLPTDKKLLLFAPTWRDDQYTDGVGYTLDSVVDFDVLQEALGSEWVVLLRTHYYIANELDLSSYEGFVCNVSEVDDINDLYVVSDALCTDYSSVFFDYANTGRPIMFYWPDRNHYENELHGFYVDADTLPGPKCETVQELADAVLSLEGWDTRYGEAYAQFRQTYCPKDDGHATERVINRVFFGK